ncbi:integrin-linked kinase-associated serine/threonine phosphatase 2C isoform X3 [Oryzias latipes]
MDLFDDLPEPTQTSGRLSAPSASDEEEERTAKRRREDGGEDVEVKRVCKEGLPELKAYVAARRGEREEMQDAHVLLPDLMGFLPSQPELVSRLSYFAVFDGHGGARASRFAAEHLHHNLAKKFPPTEPGRSCRLTCVSVGRKPSWKDGSTATCVLVVDDVLYVANLGDSRAVMCRTEAAADGQQKLLALALSKEHNPTIYEERMRIQRAGGTVRDGRVLGVLEVSRSIGDGQYKRCGVISTPDLRRCQLTANDRFILLACDGLFKVFSADEALRFVLNVLQEAGVEQKAGLTEEELRFEAACQQLASEAVKRGCADNVTVILVSIGC